MIEHLTDIVFIYRVYYMSHSHTTQLRTHYTAKDTHSSGHAHTAERCCQSEMASYFIAPLLQTHHMFLPDHNTAS